MRSRVVLTALTGTLGCLPGPRGDSGRPCIEWPEAARPLIVGDTARLRVRAVVVSDCDGLISDRARWISNNPAVATIDSTGLVSGRAPGQFWAHAVVGSDSLSTDGFVLPAGWEARILPDSVTVRVGDTVRFQVVAFDSAARILPTVPFTVITPELLRSFDEMTAPSGPPPFTDRDSYQNVTMPAAFRAKRPGQTAMIGIIGRQRVRAALVILPADSTR
jgi:Big-like domain-containing protein